MTLEGQGKHMSIDYINQYFKEINDLINLGKYDLAKNHTDYLYTETIKNIPKNNNEDILILFNISGIYIDIGQLKSCDILSSKGLEILNTHQKEIIRVIGEDSFYYNLGNARSNLIKDKNPFNNTFSTIEDLIAVKSNYWKATRAFNKNNPKKFNPEYLVNLGNSLKRQFRLAEALQYYDQVNALNLDIPEAWINRSESLILLNQISNTYSIQMIHKIIDGYKNVLTSKHILPQWIPGFKSKILFHQQEISKICNDENLTADPHDEKIIIEEFNALSNYRKFCIENYLTLSEHALYCPCAGSSRDNLTIPTQSGIVGDFVTPMEMILNRLKSEFSFARHLYFDYLTEDQNIDLQHESCFSELFNDEILGIDVEKLRTSFRLCFGILDKIAVAICDLFDLYPEKGEVYFQNFWQLDQNDRREKFNKNKSPGLLALYSIATDLNTHKDGEWSFLKDLRNKLEHQFVVVHKYEKPSDIYNSFSFLKEIVFIKEDIFISHLKQILQLTRSAIFSFVFTVRDKAISEKNENLTYISNEILRKDYV